MKARHIRKLRKRIAKFDKYDIFESVGLFGSPYWSTKEATVTADSLTLVMERFFSRYSRTYKRHHNNWTTDPRETKECWGRFEVVNLRTGFHHYVR